MKVGILVDAPADDAAWTSFIASLNMGVQNELLQYLIAGMRAAGAVSVLREQSYIDRDFSSAYSAFYSTLFRPYRKFCQRLHFFASDISSINQLIDPNGIMSALEAASSTYLGDIVLRPLSHAPVSSALLSADCIASGDHQEVTVKSRYRSHVLGVELHVDAMPLTQQDTRIGACAQASMWMAGRHFHNRHSGPWFSIPDITQIALDPIDSGITRSLPAGSEWLSQDNMVRALRAMGRHPVMYAPDAIVQGKPSWQKLCPRSIIARYVDSGVPVLLGLQKANQEIGHGVVVVGMERVVLSDTNNIAPEATTAEFVSHFLVNDDQRGAYRRLPTTAAFSTGEYPFCLETDVKFILVPLPAKVFLTGDRAEIASRNMMAQVALQRHAIVEQALGPNNGWDVDASFYSAVLAGAVAHRTYLTYGWKYKARMLRNNVSDGFKSELLITQLPRFVWVTELSSWEDANPLNACERRISGHVVVDATGSRFGEWPLILDSPGLSVFWQYDPDRSMPTPVAVVEARLSDGHYWPKIRGQMDYSICTV